MGFARGYLGGNATVCVLLAVLSTVSSCGRSTVRQAERDDLVVENERLRQETQATQNALHDEQGETAALRERIEELQERLEALDPSSPPQFEQADAIENTLTLDRLFSVKTGTCFDRQGRSRCLYHAIGKDLGGGFIVYRTNRVFAAAPESPIVDDLGRSLEVLTIQASELVLAWERENPYGAIRLSTQP